MRKAQLRGAGLGGFKQQAAHSSPLAIRINGKERKMRHISAEEMPRKVRLLLLIQKDHADEPPAKFSDKGLTRGGAPFRDIGRLPPGERAQPHIDLLTVRAMEQIRERLDRITFAQSAHDDGGGGVCWDVGRGGFGQSRAV